jgi:hypothetical protein
MSDQTRVALERRHEISWTDSHLRPDKFQTISFARARFDGEVDFSGRIFAADADFINARFYYPPDFDTATNHARIDLTGARVGFVPEGKWIHWTKNSRIPVRFRSFRKLAEETKNHDLERDLYIEERKAERGVYLCHRWEALKNRPYGGSSGRGFGYPLGLLLEPKGPRHATDWKSDAFDRRSRLR